MPWGLVSIPWAALHPFACGEQKHSNVPWWLCRHFPHIHPPPKLKDEILKNVKSGLNFASQHLEGLAGLLAYCPSALSWPSQTSSTHTFLQNPVSPSSRLISCIIILMPRSPLNFNHSFLCHPFLIYECSVFCYFSKDINDNFSEVVFCFLAWLYFLWFDFSPSLLLVISLSYWKISLNASEILVYSC